MEKMNILVAVNRSYIPHLKVLICSLGKNNNAVIDVYLMHSELEEPLIAELSGFVSQHTGGRLISLKLDGGFLQHAALMSHFSIEMYYRIFASEFLPKTMDRILWLDSDIVVLKNLAEFYHSDFSGKSVIVCAHRERNTQAPEINEEALRRLNLRDSDVYFNSGVILMNLDKMRAEFDRDAALQLIEGIPNRPANHKILYPDQDILNILYQDDKLLADKDIYNYQTHFDWRFPNEKEHIAERVAILHYVGPAKPWKHTTSHFSYGYYWKYYLRFGSKRKYVACKIRGIAYAAYRVVRQIMKRIVR